MTDPGSATKTRYGRVAQGSAGYGKAGQEANDVDSAKIVILILCTRLEKRGEGRKEQ